MKITLVLIDRYRNSVHLLPYRVSAQKSLPRLNTPNPGIYITQQKSLKNCGDTSSRSGAVLGKEPSINHMVLAGVCRKRGDDCRLSATVNQLEERQGYTGRQMEMVDMWHTFWSNLCVFTTKG